MASEEAVSVAKGLESPMKSAVTPSRELDFIREILAPSNSLEEGDSDTDTDPSPGPSSISGRSSKVKGSTNKEENKVPNAEE